ncbi:ATP-binding protein [Alkalicella caledoniensis]|uniref:ATP-binding protein n=1 Tax=Alkalicella caledoniensis TaxID=2731377 RepID=A0A7G9W3V8_ALKCA|nr:IS21-like element helper ATPase IstB [Alkalicella caledoniensis]QNO13370.1 ATP-binding protein [Alkalicella caledoniensis]
MTVTLTEVKKMLNEVRMPYSRDNIEEYLKLAVKEDMTCLEFAHMLLRKETSHKSEIALQKRIKQANFPYVATIEDFDFSFQTSVTKRQITQLLDMNWVEKAFNLLFLGPPSVGKTHLAVSLGMKAVEMGYKVSFISMDHLIKLLKTEEISNKSQKALKKIMASDMVAIDEVGYLPITRQEANQFFQLVSALYQNTSIIITSNKGFDDWVEIMGDPVITTAILDRLVHNSEIFNMTGDSWRLKNRNTIFSN